VYTVVFLAFTSCPPSLIIILFSLLTPQAGSGGQSLNCSYVEKIWQDVQVVTGIREDHVSLWCNISLLPVIAAFNKPGDATPAFNMTVRQFIVFLVVVFLLSNATVICQH